MKIALHRATDRGYTEHGWLHSWHSLSFADYHNLKRVHFGKLRVINDDVVEPGAGFRTHAHANMEIISIPLSGALRHTDSMGHEQVIKPGDVQVMSAGRGLTHSEYNASTSAPVNFLQIWIFPEQRNIEPRYEQKSFDPSTVRNRFQTIVAPRAYEHGGLYINQRAYLNTGLFDAGEKARYSVHDIKNGVYLFLIDGSVQLAGKDLNRRDACGVRECEHLELDIQAESQVLLIEVPMS